MTRSVGAEPVASEIVELTEAACEIVERHVAHHETSASLHPEVLDFFVEHRLFHLVAPRVYGGLELALHEAVHVVRRVAAADAAVAWYQFNAASLSMVAAQLEPSLAANVLETGAHFAGSNSVGTATRRAGGGWVVSGRWPLVTGIENAAWVAMRVALIDGDTTDGGIVVLRAADLEVEPVWHDAGAMRGTGSQRAIGTNLLVDDDRIVRATAPQRAGGAIYRIGGLPLSLTLSGAVVIGVLERAVAEAQALVARRHSSVNGRAAVSSASLLELHADANCTVQNLRAGADAVIDALCATDPPSLSVRASALAWPFHAVVVARRLISDLYTRSASDAFFRGHRLEKALRDIHAISFGYEPMRSYQADAGRIALGLAPGIPDLWRVPG